MESRVLDLARSGLHDEEILAALDAEGHRSPQRASGIHPSTIRRIRLRHGVKLPCRCTRWPAVPGWLTVKATATRIGVSEKWIRERLRSELIRTKRDESGRYLFPDSDEARNTLLQLRAKRIVPVLKGATALGAEAVADAAVVARWRMADGTTLTISINLGDEAASAALPDGPVVFAAGAPLAPASCAVWLA